jgi:hypothetical protein
MVDRGASGHRAENPPYHPHLRLRHLEGVAVFAGTEAVGRTPPLYDETVAALLEQPVLGAPRYRLPLPLGERVLHRISEAVAGVVEGDKAYPELSEILVPQEPVEAGAEEHVSLLGEHDVYGPALRRLHHAPQTGAVQVRAAVPVVHGFLDHPVTLTGGVRP